MSLSSPSPLCTVNATSTLNGVNVTAASTVTIALVDTAGVKQWTISAINTDDLLSAATVTAGLTINTVAKTATFTAPAAGSALIFQSVVNNGKDANGAVDPTLTTTFGVYVLTTSGYRAAAFDEKTEGSSSFGWVTKLNAVVRNNLVTPASAGAGMVFSGGAYNVVANADGSLVVAADDIKVGVLATDAQHGVRGGGTLHAAATGSVAGFMSAADKTLLAGATAAATASQLAARDGSGGCAFGALTSSAQTCSGNATVGGTLGVTGATTCAALACTTLAASGNATVGGTLAITGATTCAALTCSSLTLSGTAKVGLASRTITRVIATAFVPATANWTNADTGSGTYATSTTALAYGHFHLALPTSATITTIKVYVEGGSGHAGAPTVMPYIQLYNKAPSVGGSGTTASAAQYDTYGSAGAYESPHAITLSGVGYFVDRSSVALSLLVYGESLGNVVAGFKVHGCVVTYATTSMDDGPCN
jgi:hypothetical protein